MKRQPAGSRNGGQFARDQRGQQPPSTSQPQTTLPEQPSARTPSITDQYDSFLATRQSAPEWQPPSDLNEQAITLAHEMDGDPFLDDEPRDNGAYRDAFYQELARRVLPDMTDASPDDLAGLAVSIRRAGVNARLMWLANAVQTERAYRENGAPSGVEVADFESAERRVEDALRAQGSSYTPIDLMRTRLEQVQEGLAEPVEYSTITVKPPSGFEIEVSKPDARALLLEAGIEPLAPRRYTPIWPIP